MKRYSGAFLGVAVGDALGAPVEFMTREEILRRYRGGIIEMHGGGTWGMPPGSITDDTAMAMCVARGVCDNQSDPVRSIGREFIRWYRSRPIDIGSTCRMAIEKAMLCSIAPSNAQWKEAAESARMILGKACGNGALMRTVYIGLYYCDAAEIATHAEEIARMTHDDDVCAADCAAYSLMINNLINGRGIDGIREALRYKDCLTRYDMIELAKPDFMCEPNGYAVNSMKVALNAVLSTDSFKKAIIKAVNRGGDTDTNGAITGGLAGAMYGEYGIPISWMKTLERKAADEIRMLAEAAEEHT